MSETIILNHSTRILAVKSDSIENSGFETVLFNKQMTSLLHCPVTVKGRYTIPKTVKMIGDEAFSQCLGLTSILIPRSVQTIGSLAFESCIGLSSITIPESVVELGYRVFSNCIGLKSLFIRSKSRLNLLLNSEVFHKVDKTVCTLYVSPGTKKDYQQASQWEEFENIVELRDFRHAQRIAR